MPRLVVVLFGPPGAGKTTIARQQEGLTVYDRDDAQWAPGGEGMFRRAIEQLADDPQASAVVIRSGATSAARATAIAKTQATHAYVVIADPQTCHYRAGHRRRRDTIASHAAIDKWFANHDTLDGIPPWPGSWDRIRSLQELGVTITPKRARHWRRYERSKAGDPRSTSAWRALRKRVFEEETHCWRCHRFVDQTLPRDHPDSRTVDHLDPIGCGGAGVPDRSMVRLAHRRCNSQRGHRARAQRQSLTVTIGAI